MNNFLLKYWCIIAMRSGTKKSLEMLESLTTSIGPFIRGKIRRELYHLYEHVLSNKTHLS